jgi:type I restriction enzyme R subunit
MDSYMTQKFTEKKLVEDYILKKLEEKGWRFVPSDDLERDNYAEPLLIPNLVRALERINKEIGIGDEEIKKVVNYIKLKLTGTRIEEAKQILDFYEFGVSVKFEKEKVVKYVQLFDFEDIENNKFIVTRQVHYDGSNRIRADIVLYVNGIPLVNIECKNPASVSESWYNAYRQIKEYEKTVPELYKYVQIGIAAESTARYFTIVPWQKEVKIHEWREEGKDSLDSMIEMLSRDTLLDIIRNFLFFRVEFGDATKVVTRYMQYRAANKIVNRVRESLESIESMESGESIESMESGESIESMESGESIESMESGESMESRESGESMESRESVESIESRESIGSIESRGEDRRPKKRGLIWHWQGSGKTLTMIFAANKLYYLKELENPTIFFIVDRIDLEEQLRGEFNSLDIVKPEVVSKVEDLKEILTYDGYRGKRGLFITLIHKFRENDLKYLQAELDELTQARKTIESRKNVIAFIDEGHRSQYGILAAQRKSILRNAFVFAFTGTPIAKRGRDTYKEFSYPPGEPYLDSYFIKQSQSDGFTVKIAYQPRLEGGEVHLKKDDLKGFLDSTFEELPEEIREEVEEKVKKRLNTIKLILEDPKRIKVVAEDIARHFQENIDGKFKAMVVAASREACVHYKRELDKHLPREYSEIEMTYKKDDGQEIQRYVAEARESYGGRDFDDIKKDTIERFKEKDIPKILIVTEMLLAGFDAPQLQVMYLDKPLKEHRLLQAVARTNRPFKDLKGAGVVIDYVGILKEFKKALEIYSEKDIKGALIDFDTIKDDFATLIKEILEILKDVPKDYERETLLKAIEVITTDEEKEKEFTQKYKKLRKIFELLGPDEIKLENFDSYKWLSAIYTYYLKVVLQISTYEEYVEKYCDKTIKFVHQSTEIERIEKDLPVIAFDEEYLQALEKKVKGRKEKAASILFTLNKLVLVERYRKPIYESLVEMVERLLEMWKEKTRDYERIYSEGVKILDKMNVLTERQKTLGFSDLEYSMLIVLENKLTKDNEMVKEVKDISGRLAKHMFPGWFNQTTAKKDLEKEIRRFVRGFKGRYNLSLDEVNDLHTKLVESIKNYGIS